MFVSSSGNITKTRRISQANADQTGEPWVIFTDTSGNLRTERQRTGPKDVVEVIYPRPDSQRSVSFLMTLFDDDSTRKKLEVLDPIDVMFDDDRNKIPDLYHRLVQVLPGGKLQITIQRLDDLPLGDKKPSPPAPA